MAKEQVLFFVLIAVLIGFRLGESITCLQCSDYSTFNYTRYQNWSTCTGKNLSSNNYVECPSNFCYFEQDTYHFNTTRHDPNSTYITRDCFDASYHEGRMLPYNWTTGFGINKTWDCFVYDFMLASLNEDLDRVYGCTCNDNFCNSVFRVVLSPTNSTSSPPTSAKPNPGGSTSRISHKISIVVFFCFILVKL